MQKKGQKEDSKGKLIGLAIAVTMIIILGFFMLKPTITGFAVITKESTFDDNLNLVINESTSVIWNLRNPGDLKSVKASGAISKNGSAKVYIEKDGERLLIFDSTKTLFDINVEVLPDYKRIFVGDELLIQIILFNLKGFGSVKVDVMYSIKDNIGNLIATEDESVTVETQAKFIRKLLIPTDLKAGTYVAFVEVRTPDGLVGTSSDLFVVEAKFEEEFPVQFKFLGLGVIILFILVVIIVSIRKLKKKKKIIEVTEKKPSDSIEKLGKELKALESAYKSKFISAASYNRDKVRIEKEIKKLKG